MPQLTNVSPPEIAGLALPQSGESPVGEALEEAEEGGLASGDSRRGEFMPDDEESLPPGAHPHPRSRSTALSPRVRAPLPNPPPPTPRAAWV